MAIDTSYPSWLIPKESPVDALLKGVQAGTAIAHTRAQFQQIALETLAQRQRQDLAERKFEIDARQQDLDHQMTVDWLSDMPTLQNWARDPSQPPPANLKSPKSIETMGRIRDVYDRSVAGRALNEAQSSYWKKIEPLAEMDRITVQAMMREANQGRPATSWGITPEIAKYIDDATERAPSKQPAAAIEARNVTALRHQANDAEKFGNTTKAEELRHEADVLEAHVLGASQMAETTETSVDEQGHPVVRIIKAPFQKKNAGEKGPLTAATQTMLEKDVANTRQSLGLMAEIQNSIRPQDVGFMGVVGENMLDKLLPQFGVTTLDPQRTSNRTKLRTLISTMARQVSFENRFSNADIERIKEIMPSLGVLENVDRAKEVLGTLTDIFADRNMRDRVSLGRPIEMNKLTNEEIAAGVRQKIFDYNTALEFLKANR